MTDYVDINGLGHYDSLIKDYIDAHSGGGSCPAKTFYGTSTTAAGTQAKVVVCPDFTASDLKAGTVLYVMMGNAQTYNGAATLNVNNTGAVITQSVSGTNNYRYCWYKNEVVCFVHDGTSWVMQDGFRADTTYYGVTKLSSSVASTSESLAATPKAVKTAYDLAVAAMPGTYQILEQPTSANASSGMYASFHVGTNDAGATYQWQWYVNSGWARCPHQGNDSPTLYVVCGTVELAAQYRCVVTFSDGTTETSSTASIDSTAAFRIVKQPESVIVAATGNDFSFTVEVDDASATYRWQTCSDGSTWSNSSLLNNATKTLGPIGATAGRQTYLYRCRVQFSDRTAGDYVYTEPVTVTVNADAQAQVQSVQSENESI